MSVLEILKTAYHRPRELPAEPWRFYQEWNNAIFLHYQVEISELKPFVPNELKIDLFDGKPWVSIVAFTMENVRMRYLPAFPPISDFDEINIRTYVSFNNKSGVYFLSIEAGKKWSCKLAKAISELPYRYSRINRRDDEFISLNTEFNDELRIVYKTGKQLKEKTELDKWLTERYVLYQDTGDSINEYEIHHLEWPLQEVELRKLEVSYPGFDRLLKRDPDKYHYSKGVKVIAWGKRKFDKMI